MSRLIVSGTFGHIAENTETLNAEKDYKSITMKTEVYNYVSTKSMMGTR